MKYYGIMFKGKPMGFETLHDGLEVVLDVDYDDSVWLVTNKDDAKNAIITDRELDGSCYNRPVNRYLKQANEMSVFEVEIP